MAQLTRRNFIKMSAIALTGVAAYPLLTVEIAHASDKRILVVYFSLPYTTNPNNMTKAEADSTVVIDGKVLGNTQYFAQVIQEKTDGDIFRIEADNPYPLNHDRMLVIAKDEQEKNARPALKAKIDNLAQYDVIFIGYPIWYYQMPMILRTFFEQHDFSGKIIVPFNTHGGSGFSGTIDVITQMQPNAMVRKDGLSISRDHIEDAKTDIEKWLSRLDALK